MTVHGGPGPIAWTTLEHPGMTDGPRRIGGAPEAAGKSDRASPAPLWVSVAQMHR